MVSPDGSALGYPEATRCRRPDGYSLTIVPHKDTAEARGRCGHPIYARHQLMLNGSIPVIDTSALQEPKRDEWGVRPLGLCGLLFGCSPHRCDACKRARELINSIVCPCCRRTVMLGDQVRLVSTVDVQTEHDDLRPFFVTTEDDAFTVVCESCANNRANMTVDGTGYIWIGDAVLGPNVFSDL